MRRFRRDFSPTDSLPLTLLEGQSLKLLIIGDEDLLVEALGRLAPATASISYAATADEAATHAQASRPEMIVVVGELQDPALGALLEAAHARDGTIRVGVGPGADAEMFDHCIVESDTPAVVERLEQLVAEYLAEVPSPDSVALDTTHGTLEEQLAAQAQDLKALERRVTEVALGTTAGLSELIESMDGVQQALKLHTRMIEAVKQQHEGPRPGSPGRDRNASDTAEILKAQLETQSQDLKSLKLRVHEVAQGTTGGLTELVEAADGVQQAIKLHARRIDRLEQRIETEVMALHESVLALRRDIKELRHDVAAIDHGMPTGLAADLAEDLESEMDLLIEPQDDASDESRPRPAASRADSSTAKDRH